MYNKHRKQQRKRQQISSVRQDSDKSKPHRGLTLHSDLAVTTALRPNHNRGPSGGRAGLWVGVRVGLGLGIGLGLGLGLHRGSLWCLIHDGDGPHEAPQGPTRPNGPPWVSCLWGIMGNPMGAHEAHRWNIPRRRRPKQDAPYPMGSHGGS
ncbi:unnamed protein product [Pylaiella littoralis]